MTRVPYLGDKLRRFANKARISISSPVNNGIPWVTSIEQDEGEINY